MAIMRPLRFDQRAKSKSNVPALPGFHRDAFCSASLRAVDRERGNRECHLKLEKLGKLAFRAVDSDFPGLEGLGTDWRLAVCALADRIEASIQEGEDAARERNIPNTLSSYAE